MSNSSVQRGSSKWGAALLAVAALSLSPVAAAGQVRFAGEGHAYHPMWSLDGKHIAFEVNRYAGDVDLFVSEVNGAIAKDAVKVALPGGGNVFGSGQVVVNAIWHPQGVAVFEGSNQGGQFRLYYHQPGGGAAAEMISAQDIPGDLTFPNVSADGKTLAFIADATGNGDIRTRDTNTGSLSQITTTDHAEMFPQFAADGTKLLFTRKQNNTEDVFTLDLASKSESPVVGGGGDQTRPAYAADGRVVYFDGARGEGAWDVAVVDGPGGAKKMLAKGVRLPLRARPAVSPDGKWVAFAFDDPTKADAVVVARVDGSKSVTIDMGHKACGEPAIGTQGGRVLLAYTALPSSGSDWRFLQVVDITDKL
jgi:Tol biopolymer transport system component